MEAKNFIERLGAPDDLISRDYRIGMTDAEARQFSVAKLMRVMVDSAYEKHAGLELAACRAVSDIYKPDKDGFWLPRDIADIQKRALTATGGGISLVQTSVSQDWWAPALTNAAKCVKLGATVVSSSASVAIPRVKPGSTPAATAENVAPPGSDLTLELPTWAPKTLANFMTVSKRLLAVAGTLTETIVRNDLVEAVAVLLDLYAIQGTGASGQPTGILNTSGLTTSAIGANGGAPAYTNIVDVLRQASLKKGVVGEKLGWLGNTKVMSTMRLVNKATNWGFLWDDPPPDALFDGQILGYPASVSDNVPSTLTKGSGTNLSALIFGNWADLFIVEFSPVGVFADPYSFSSTGAVRFNVFQDVDVQPRRIDSFCAIVDMIAA